jgi:LytS/YehU family sensor histidine kinase
MQTRYLALERRRFPDRLVVVRDLDPEVEHALVPALLLQPLVENAIKYGVERSAAPVTLSLRAEPIADGRLRILIEDDARPASGVAPPGGFGIGLSNVAQRLRARFGEAARCEAGPRPDGGFRVELLLPLVCAP